MRRVSLNARQAQDASASDEIEITLIYITHPALDEPIRLTTDPTERLSIEPLMYGTHSTWQTTDGTPFLYAMVSVLLPDDQEDAPTAATFVVEAVDNDLAIELRSTTTRASVAMAVVLASTPNVIEAEWTGLALMSAAGDAIEITLSVSRQPITSEPFPGRRMTRAVMPGLHR